jgi:transmembrane sensor
VVNPRQDIEEQAALWAVRMADSPGAATQSQFEAWWQSSIHHEIAFEKAMAAWERLDILSRLPNTPVAPEKSKPQRLRWMGMAAAVALVLGLGAGLLPDTAQPAMAYATHIGERRQIRLNDGTQIELSSNTVILVRFVHSQREVELRQGEAAFRIAKDPRPFTVHAGRLQVQSGEAELAVRAEDQTTRLIVTRGAVEMAGNDDNMGLSRMAVQPGTVARLSADLLEVQHLPAGEIDRQLAWRSGAIEFNGQTLADALQEFNRYNLRQLKLGDTAAGALRIGGYFQANDPNSFVDAVTKSLPVRAERDAQGRIVLLLRHEDQNTDEDGQTAAKRK